MDQFLLMFWLYWSDAVVNIGSAFCGCQQRRRDVCAADSFHGRDRTAENSTGELTKMTGVTRNGLAFFLAFGCLAIGVESEIARADGENDTDFFEKRIRPIFVERCESCHSASKGKTNGGLALDTRDGWKKGGESGIPVVPGEPDKSLLIHAVRYDADGPQMPPKEAGGRLTASEIAAFTEWVIRGAPDSRTAVPRGHGMTPEEVRNWWSFQKIRAVSPPVEASSKWARTDLDRFILAALEQRKLSPSVPADKRTLLRRVTFDLTGLPPTLAEVEAFMNDSADDAFERVVNRLLDSPAYGQRWARHWLDVARYADYYDANPKTRTASCELTEAWRYRDWVVEAFNHDIPFDQFVQHQIAGDLLPSPTGEDVYPAGLIATTFLSNGVWDRGDADKEKIISDMADDNIDTVGKAFLGLTLGCARCHDHKFDPITTEDYYALAGIFYSSHILKDLGAKGAEYDMNRTPLVPKSIVARRKEQEEALKAAQAKLELLDQSQRYVDMAAGGTILVPIQFLSSPDSRGTIGPDGVVTVDGSSRQDSYTIKAIAPAGDEIRFVRLEALRDSQLPVQGPGRGVTGNFMINRFTLFVNMPESESAPTSVKWSSAKANWEQKGFVVAGSIDDKPQSGWSIGPYVGCDHVAVFEIAADMKIPSGALLTFIIDQNHADEMTLGKFRLSYTSVAPTNSISNVPERTELVAGCERLKVELSVPLPVAMAVEEGGMPGGLFPKIQDVPIHLRGSYARLGAVVPRRMPRVLAGDNQPAISSGSGRRELANWVASNDNPLTARVIVNRVWQWHFGEGLVRTPSNFGKMGELPTHPELLDWLTTKFMDEGWSLKNLHRRILFSATYQQTSQVPREMLPQDPENRWLGRFSSRRIEAEAIRDAMLFVSGQLNSIAGGPADDDFTSLRRSLYVQTARWDRSGYAMLFDAANPDSSTERRMVSTVAPQALLFLNHDFILSQARQLAQRLLAESPYDDVTRIQYAYQLLFGRFPRGEELEIARRIIITHNTEVEAGWTDFAHILLCSNEFVYLD